MRFGNQSSFSSNDFIENARKESKKRHKKWDMEHRKRQEEFQRESDKELKLFAGLTIAMIVGGTVSTLGVCYGIYKVISLFV